MSRPRQRSRGPGALCLALLTALCVLALGGEVTQGSFTTATVSNSDDSTATGQVRGTHAYAGQSCDGGGPSPTDCPGSPVATGASSTSAQTVNDTFTNTSTVGGRASFTQQVRVESCGPAQFEDSVGGNADPMLPRYRVGRQVADRWGATSAAHFDGADDYAADVVPTTTSAQGNSSYSIGLWVRAAPGSGGGGLMSLNASPVNSTSGGANPTLYMDPTGKIRVKADGPLGIPLRLDSPGTYRDGAWHHVVTTVSVGGTTSLALYVDGASVDTAGTLNLLNGTFTDAYWHLGWQDTTALGSSAGNPTAHFTGDLSGAFITSTAMTASQVSTLWRSTSMASYAAAIPSATHLWRMGEDITSTFGGSIGFISGGRPCAQVTLAWKLGSVTAMSGTLSSLADGAWRPTPGATAPSPGSSQTLQTSYTRASSYDTDVAGMELYAPLGHRLVLGSWTAPFRWARAVVLG